MYNKVGDKGWKILDSFLMQNIISIFICLCMWMICLNQRTVFQLSKVKMVITKHLFSSHNQINFSVLTWKLCLWPSLKLLAEATRFLVWDMLVLSKVNDAISLHKSLWKTTASMIFSTLINISFLWPTQELKYIILKLWFLMSTVLPSLLVLWWRFWRLKTITNSLRKCYICFRGVNNLIYIFVKVKFKWM